MRLTPKQYAVFLQKRAARRALHYRRVGLPIPPGPSVVPPKPPGAVIGYDPEQDQEIFSTGADRRQGTYVLGGTGTGKTTLIENIITADIHDGFGVCVLDPHGDLVINVLRRVPKGRENDVVLLNPADIDHPFGLNIYDCPDPTKQLVLERTVDQAMHLFYKLWGPDGERTAGWGARMEDMLRVCSINLAETPGTTMLELMLILLADGFRDRMAAQSHNFWVRHYWEREFPILLKSREDPRGPLTNKARTFVMRPTIANIVGQSFTQQRVSFRRFMDERKIVLVPLSAGLLGSDVAALLGSMIVGEILSAALSRQDEPPQRRPAFHLFADEFQHFATKDFAELLAQARKYGVAILMAHQYREQLTEELRAATLTAANLIAFTMSGGNAAELAGQYDNTPEPGRSQLEMVTWPSGGYEVPAKRYANKWDSVGEALYQRVDGPQRLVSDMVAERANELANLRPYHARVKLRQGNERSEYLLRTMPSPLTEELTPEEADRVARLIAQSRQRYCRPRSEVEAEIDARLAYELQIQAPSAAMLPRPVAGAPEPAIQPPTPGRLRRTRPVPPEAPPTDEEPDEPESPATPAAASAPPLPELRPPSEPETGTPPPTKRRRAQAGK